MKTFAVFAILGSLALISCGRDAPVEKSVEKGAREAGATVIANDYSGGEYVSGVSAKPGSTSFFYFLINSDATAPVKVGSKLTFAKSGSATVTKVDSAPQSGKTAVFVHVDKTLDPAGDGYPNPIRVH